MDFSAAAAMAKAPPRMAASVTTRDAVLGAAQEWITARQLAAAIGASQRTTLRVLWGLMDSMEIVSRPLTARQNSLRLYKVAPPGYRPPLYETHLDARPLADCFNGYSFLKGKSCPH